jgi:salicylate hydroxylase
MQVIVVGAGIGGLSVALSLAISGHQVTILESAPTLAEIGAGVQLTPNSTRYFWKWGLGPDIQASSVFPNAFNVRQDKNGELLGRVPFKDFEARYGGSYIVIHRADIHRILHEHAVRAGAKLRLSSKVIRYDFEGGRVELASGEELQGDLVIAVDGINSFARRSFLPEVGDGLEKTGHAAYRTMAPVDAVKANPKTAHIVAKHDCNCWVGEKRLIMTYMIKNAQKLNLVLSHPDDVDTSDWTSERYQTELQELYGKWDPSVRALLSLASPDIQNWPIYQVKTLPKWTSKSGKFVLMGDAAHAMAFYLSMGVSMAVEDAEALTTCLSLRERNNASPAQAMNVFETVRKARAEAVRDASLHAGNVLQLLRGPEQEHRDRALREDGLNVLSEDVDDFWLSRTSYGIADRKIRDWCYGYDVKARVYEEWERLSA